MFAIVRRGYEPSAYEQEPIKDTESLLKIPPPPTPAGYALAIPTRDTFGIGKAI